MKIQRETWNVIQLGAGFFLILLSFMGSSFIQEMVISTLSKERNISQHAGYNSLAILYAMFTVCNFLAPPLIQILGRWSLPLAASTYAIFQVGFLFLNEPYLYASSALLGLGAAVIWTAQGKYLSLNSTKETAGLHSGIFWACAQGCITFGGIYLFIVFKWGPEKIDDTLIYILYGVFTGLTLGGILFLLFLRFPKTKVETKSLTELELVKSSFKLLATKPVLLLMVTSAYTGIELSFLTGIYPSCIGFTKQLNENNTKIIVGLAAITQGLGQISGGFLFGILSSKTSAQFGRGKTTIFGTLIFLLAFVGIYLNFPSSAPLHSTNDIGVFKPRVWAALVIGFLLGLGDSTINTQIFAYFITQYPDQISQVFSLNKFFQHLMTCFAFYYGARLSLEIQLIMLVVGAILGCVCFCLAERCIKDENNKKFNDETLN